MADPSNHRDREQALREREAREALARVRDAETAGQSAFARAAGHFAAKDAEGRDWAEIWGRRIGRGLAAVFAILLVVWLVGHLTR